MKQILLSILLFSSAYTRGQAPIFKPYQHPTFPQKYLSTDSTIRVVYIDDFKDSHDGRMTAVFLNGKQAHPSIMATIQYSLLDSFYVHHESIHIGQDTYHQQYYIKTKSTYTPKLISLNELKRKYVELKIKTPIFMLNGNIIDADYDQYIVDENYILSIVIETIKHVKRGNDVGFIKLLTKSPENIKKSKEIRVRGSEVSMNK